MHFGRIGKSRDETCRACRTAQRDTLHDELDTLDTSYVSCRVERRRDMTSQVEFWLNLITAQ